jgi:hypothetical protein
VLVKILTLADSCIQRCSLPLGSAFAASGGTFCKFTVGTQGVQESEGSQSTAVCLILTAIRCVMAGVLVLHLQYQATKFPALCIAAMQYLGQVFHCLRHKPIDWLCLVALQCSFCTVQYRHAAWSAVLSAVMAPAATRHMCDQPLIWHLCNSILWQLQW